MEIQERHGINFQLNPKDFTASIVESPKASGIVAIPRLFRFNKKNYKITTIKSNAFHNNTIESIAFANNSEVTTFEDDAFEKSSISKLQIPPKLKSIENRSFFLLKNVIEFEVSPNNPFFSCYNNELLIGKNDEKQENFDILYLGRSDLKKVTIPASIKIIKRYAFGESSNLESIKFEKISQIEYIEGWVLCEKLKKFEIPRKLKGTESDAFQYANSLTDLKVSPKNKVYSWYNNTLLVRKNDENEIISFCRRDVSEIEIPRNIKEIDPFAFKKCENLVSIKFEEDSILEIINENAFESVIKPKEVIVPSVKIIKKLAFSYMKSLKSIQFLGENIEIANYCFYSSDNLIAISFPNSKKIICNDLINETLKIYVRKDAEISGNKIDENKDHIIIIEDLIEKSKSKNDNNNNFGNSKNTNNFNSKTHFQNQKQVQSQIQNRSQSKNQNQDQFKNQIQDQTQDQNQNQFQIQHQDQIQIQNHDQTQNQFRIQHQDQFQISNQNDELKSKSQNDLNQETDNNSSKCCLLI